MNKSCDFKYVLITPARNEEEFIEKTIKSVLSQTHLPERWIIVSDGSTDQTDEIVKRYLSDNQWIELIRMPYHYDRQFAAKVHCFNTGYEKMRNIQYDIIGNLDADISFGKDYFSFLMEKFSEDPRLGVGGTPFFEGGSHYDYRFTNIEHVSGACQLFRRECFEEIGGYKPIKSGGIDWMAVTTARMRGWKTRTFLEKKCVHHRSLGTGNTNTHVARFRDGIKDYTFGGHPLWELFRAIHQMKRKPYVIRGMFILLGYTWAFIIQKERPVSAELMRFYREEQMERLRRIILRTLKISQNVA